MTDRFRRLAAGLTTAALLLALASPVAAYEACGDQQDCQAAGYSGSQWFEPNFRDASEPDWERWNDTWQSLYQDAYDEQYDQAISEAWPECSC